MPYEDRAVTALEAVADRERAAEHGWALDWDLRAVKQRVFNLAERGLTVFADRDDRAALSAWEGRAVRWAARLTAPGQDLLLYSRFRSQTEAEAPDGSLQQVELTSSQMTALQLYVALAGRLRRPPAAGLAEQVHTARRDRLVNRYVLHLSLEQMECVAYAFWLHSMSRSALEANRFTRDYGITYHPDPAPGPSGLRPAAEV
ncbi:DUF6417 family protein [Streptomyces asoensis]|uniref:DUF6417 family protein n=1 Tax=Streptomyces asoensis TaxID=249586 RepID=UPI0033E78AF2